MQPLSTLSSTSSYFNTTLYHSGEVVDVPCHPFEQMLLAAGNTNLIVDYFSLDTEGSEIAILRSISKLPHDYSQRS